MGDGVGLPWRSCKVDHADLTTRPVKTTTKRPTHCKRCFFTSINYSSRNLLKIYFHRCSHSNSSKLTRKSIGKELLSSLFYTEVNCAKLNYLLEDNQPTCIYPKCQPPTAKSSIFPQISTLPLYAFYSPSYIPSRHLRVRFSMLTKQC